VLQQLEEIAKASPPFPIASTLARNLRRIWQLKGNYWEAVKKIADEQNWI
jgi:hypothetical protein